MEIKQVDRAKQVDFKTTEARFTASEVSKLICNALVEKGIEYNEADVTFLTEWKYVSDEWGMSNHVVTEFKGALVTVDGAKEV